MFRMYKKLSGMTGTGKTEEDEFREIYNMRVIPIPTNRPIQRIDHDDLLYSTLMLNSVLWYKMLSVVMIRVNQFLLVRLPLKHLT